MKHFLPSSVMLTPFVVKNYRPDDHDQDEIDDNIESTEVDQELSQKE
ncbi:hypothetical protein Vpro01_00745 [Vibrio proteolyticus]